MRESLYRSIQDGCMVDEYKDPARRRWKNPWDLKRSPRARKRLRRFRSREGRSICRPQALRGRFCILSKPAVCILMPGVLLKNLSYTNVAEGCPTGLSGVSCQWLDGIPSFFPTSIKTEIRRLGFRMLGLWRLLALGDTAKVFIGFIPQSIMLY